MINKAAIMNLKNLFAHFFVLGFLSIQLHAQTSSQPVRVIVIGAHPDDCDLDAGGTAILFSQMGCAVKFLSVTNGDAGHQTEGGGALAKRRAAEAKEAGKRFGVAYDILDNHDGELEPGLAVRLQIIRKIREWNADIVIAPRPNDYHPDHRYTGVLVQDAAYMVGVPNVVPDVAPLKKNPVFLYSYDHFKKPNLFTPDIAVDITAVYDKKIYALDAHISQFYEWLPWIGGYADQVPAAATDRIKWLATWYDRPLQPEVKTALEKYYGKQKAATAKYAEVFEICEYGAQPDEKTIKRLFPMLGK
ncbi:MAG: PIG-L family deacetylase [Chitinophagaceae bacterium]|nr:PIG-L family deacetylase [Chitinophagaceae bacterium]